VRLAKLVLDRFGVTARIAEGPSGVFDVLANGKKIFSRHDEGGRFPDEEELLEELGEL